MRYFRKITGENVYLSPINPDDVEVYTKWANDAEVAQYTRFRLRVIGEAAERKSLEHMTEGGYHFAIIRKQDDTLLGNVSLMDVDNITRRATLGIFIGESENRSRGFGTEAIRLLLSYGFDTLNLHNIMLLVHADNARGIACYKKAGFTEFGRRREGTFKNGRYYDDIYMDILEDEFRRQK